MWEINTYVDILIEGIKYGLIIGGSACIIGEGINLAIKFFKT